LDGEYECRLACPFILGTAESAACEEVEEGEEEVLALPLLLGTANEDETALLVGLSAVEEASSGGLVALLLSLPFAVVLGGVFDARSDEMVRSGGGPPFELIVCPNR